MVQRTVIDLSQTPIIKSLVERSADDRVRLAGVESVQALTYSEVITRLDLILERLGIDPPPDPDPDPNPDPLTITGTPPTTGTAGQPYSFTPSAAGGTGTKVYALASGTLLAGLSLNTSTGAITGTPTTAGTMTNLSVRVTDDTGSAATTPTTVTIAAATPPATITVDPLVQRSGQDYIFTARRLGDTSSAVSRTMKVAASTDYLPGSPESDWPNGYATVTANFAAGSPTATFPITAPVAAQPE